MNTLIDTHIHLDSVEFYNDLEGVIASSKLYGVSRFIIPGASLETLEYAVRIADLHDEIFYAVGIHPYHIDEILLDYQKDSITDNTYDKTSQQFNTNRLYNLKYIMQTKKCCAIGECGLDFFRLGEYPEREKEAQIACFEIQIQQALKYDLPLILHVRDSKDNQEASEMVASILKKYQKNQGKSKLRGVFHCFNANEILLEFYEDFYYGIGGIITFKNAKKLVEILPKIPLNRILLETDAPYLAPIPHRGKRNESKFLPYVVTKISEILNIPEQKLCSQTTQNAQELFRL
ncbi:TatD family deoxyribonuclease [Helicobacter didelphidarum]|uniref:TatD family deoxyribonuclease n=1 Tax=Helicobacter didelphidarum TaxID=2040648 RepID=A0A3D8IL81_9HELI|nr:TatD family hydrolase [Helicobacter didelphidarum]RDU65873.1 TatD family deoxyribonuclease [Helicobacter didelphidarum]